MFDADSFHGEYSPDIVLDSPPGKSIASVATVSYPSGRNENAAKSRKSRRSLSPRVELLSYHDTSRSVGQSVVKVMALSWLWLTKRRSNAGPQRADVIGTLFRDEPETA